jgi:hypothetical protein
VASHNFGHLKKPIKINGHYETSLPYFWNLVAIQIPTGSCRELQSLKGERQLGDLPPSGYITRSPRKLSDEPRVT